MIGQVTDLPAERWRWKLVSQDLGGSDGSRLIGGTQTALVALISTRCVKNSQGAAAMFQVKP